MSVACPPKAPGPPRAAPPQNKSCVRPIPRGSRVTPLPFKASPQMIPQCTTLLKAACAVLLGSLLPHVAPAADRGVDPTIAYPTDTLIQTMPVAGRVYNIKNPPSGETPAMGNNSTNDRQAFVDAYNYIKQQYDNVVNERIAQKDDTIPFPSYTIYLPDGEYVVSDTIIYDGTDTMVNIHFVGQSRASTIIRLVDNATNFQSAPSPRPVLAYEDSSHPFNNNGTNNVCQNLTVNTGSGNAGAVGIYFQGANSALMANVTVTSGDGNGYAGIWLKTGSVQAYLKDITINGFEYGIDSAQIYENDTAWEHVSINNPTLAGIYMEGGGLSMRDLDFNQSTLHVPAVLFNGSGASCWLLDSHLNGGSSSSPAVKLTSAYQDFFARNVATSGYTVAVVNPNNPGLTGPYISEYTAFPPPTTLSVTPDTHSFAMTVQDTPAISWDATSNWVNVDTAQGTYAGAVGDGTTDDSDAIQRALTAAGTAGKSTVYFPRLSYYLGPNTKAITIPTSVTHLEFMNGVIPTGNGYFSVNAASTTPVSFVGKAGAAIQIHAARPVTCQLCGDNVTNYITGPESVYLESCSSDIGGGPNFCTPYESVWARSFNDELTSGSDIECYGGNLWIMGYKTENKRCISVWSDNGGYTEVLGGYVNVTANPEPSGEAATPMIENTESSLCYTGFTNSPDGYQFDPIISETLEGTTNVAHPSSFPSRGLTGTYANDIFVPLYIGGARPNSLGTLFAANQDIGAVSAVGSTSFDASMTYPNGTAKNTYYVDGSGKDIGSSADEFQFVNKSVSSNTITMVAKIDSIDPTSVYAKSGLMFRDGTATGAAFVSVVVESARGIQMQYRSTANMNVTVLSKSSLEPPCWVKLVRTAASSFTSYASTDGTSWTPLATVTPTLPTSVLAGLAVTAADNGSINRSIIEGVTLTTP